MPCCAYQALRTGCVHCTNAGRSLRRHPLQHTSALPKYLGLLMEVPDGAIVRDIGDGDPCKCVWDYFPDTCRNATFSIYCTPDCWPLEAKCKNAPSTLSTIKLYDTGRVDLGAFTTKYLEVGEVVGEYSGHLCQYEALVEGQSAAAIKQNSGYMVLLNANTVSRKYVYAETLKFLSHACDPNVAFIKMQNQDTVKGWPL
ncbi:Set domain-containing hypothetical protein [Phytophthora megakarya]|uniref:SET domain-containing protein n=1 Tax=Phytophthora megakarya TaxID=4795 RepID=A0A225WV70_9STRA|nr:Set domain-containing hypothetical protein [Phytophthora megakarya]